MTPSADFHALWLVLETEARGGASNALKIKESERSVAAGPILLGADVLGHRHVLIPLLAGEAVAEDRRGGAVQLRRTHVDGKDYLDLVCLNPALNDRYEQLASDVLAVAGDAKSPARMTAQTFSEFKALLAAEPSTALGEEQTVGLIAELLALREVVSRDQLRRLSYWTGPQHESHDLRGCGNRIEVKGTLVREGRIVTIHGLEQLVIPEGGHLHLAWYRFSRTDPEVGTTLPDVIKSVTDLGVDGAELRRLLAMAGYSDIHDEHYRNHPVQLEERRLYDVGVGGFPRLIPESFATGAAPPGVLRVAYAIDITFEPPHPLAGATAEGEVWSGLVSDAQ